MGTKHIPSENNRKSFLHIDSEDIIKIIKGSEASIVSFDIFDTLLFRPSINPTDIFFLLQERVKSKYDLDFVEIRGKAEQELGEENATIEEIWSFIAKKYGLKTNVAFNLMQEEIDLELSMLIARKDVKEIYDAAVSQGKRIIAVSDMYLPSNILKEALEKNGYKNIDHIYVSCENNCRKDSGKLYDVVLEKEKCNNPADILHIGDNFTSDYNVPLKKGITAIYYPNTWDIMLCPGSQWGDFFPGKQISGDPYIRIIYSFSILYLYNKNKEHFFDKRFFADLEGFSCLFLAPLTVAVALDIFNNYDIQKQYSKICFAARDGYLVQKIYDIIAGKKNKISSEYIYVSRQALCYSAFKDFFDYYDNMIWGDEEYRLQSFLNYIIVDKQLKDKLLSSLSEEDKKIDLHINCIGGRKALVPFKNLLDNYFWGQKELSQAYYRSVFSGKSQRELVFDCGYGGSVSTGLGMALNKSKLFDKYYLWENDKNRECDEKNKTETHCFFEGDLPLGLNIILEECFSPCVGSCIGFKKTGSQVVPIIDELKVSQSMKSDMKEIEENCIKYANSFKQIFGKYFKSIEIKDKNRFIDVGYRGFLSSPYCEPDMFKNIKFVDSNISGEPLALSTKIYNIFDNYNLYITTFSGTGFESPENRLVLTKDAVEVKGKIGIHYHLYNPALYEELFYYLKNFPFKFDLYITTPKEKILPVIYNIFSQKTIKNLHNVKAIKVPNRGRDVAPWLVYTKEYQKEYEYFCHLHSKESFHMGPGFGERWRTYLLSNLLSEKAAKDIFYAFEKYDSLGAVFPQPFQELKNICIQNNVSQYGDFNEIDIINALLPKMNITEKYNRSDLLFSEGTMLWYRTKAMQPLFDLDLKIEDFPKEPIGVGGTIAHVVERLISIVPGSQGYFAKMYNMENTVGNTTVVVQPGPGVIGVRGALRNYVHKKCKKGMAEFLCKLLRI